MEVEIITSAQVIPCLEAYYGPVRHYLKNPNSTGEHERDSQRKRVYEAERDFENQFGSGAHFSKITECQEYASSVIGSPYWKKRFPYITSVIVKHKRGKHALASFHLGTIELPWCFYNQLTILHELAHHVVPPPHAFHGPLWCKVYVDLVAQFLGKKYGKQLARSFDKMKVKYGPCFNLDDA